MESSVWHGREGFPVEVSGQGLDGYVRLGLTLQKGQEGGSRGREEGIVYKDLEAGLGRFVDVGFHSQCGSCRGSVRE